MAEKRIQKEFQVLSKEGEKKGKKAVWLVNNNIRHWKAIIEGPENSVFEGG